MDDLLTPVSTTYLKATKDPEPLLTEVRPSKPAVASIEANQHLSSPDDVLNILKGQPDYDSLIRVLKFLTNRRGSPTPKTARIIQLLVAEIAPNYWTLLAEDAAEADVNSKSSHLRDNELFLTCLRNVAGVNALVTQLKSLIREAQQIGKDVKRPDIELNLRVLLDVLAAVLRGDDVISGIWSASTAELQTPSLRRVQSQQLVSAIASGQVVSVAAEASAVAGRDKIRATSQWLGDGLEFSKWAGRNVASWARLLPEGDELKACYDLFQRGMSLGYPDALIKTVVDQLLLTKASDPATFIHVAFHHNQTAKKTLGVLLKLLAQKLNHLTLEDRQPDQLLSAAAAIIQQVIANDDTRRNQLVDWCATSSGAGLGHGIGIRRAVLAALATDNHAIVTVLEKSLAQFGDELYIKHAAILQQEVHAQILLLSAGYVHRVSPLKLTLLIRSGSYLSTISNRIAATQMRVRFLGMVVGEALSALIDSKDKRLNFHLDDAEVEEAQLLKSLVDVSDKLGSVEAIQSTRESPAPSQPRAKSMPKPTARLEKRPKPTPTTTSPPKPIIQEVGSSDDGEDDDDDLAPYAKGSNPEDSDEDATMVQRNKIKPPVYIRDLISYLRDSESYDKQKLAVESAPVLIRRKANYGTEVSFHADELAGLFVGLQDKFDIKNFDGLRLQCMIALVVAQPKTMAPWFARTFFEGDYSLSQRTSVLIALGLSARELAGFQSSEYETAAAFPSKRLPEKMEPLYLDASQQSDSIPSARLKALPANALDTISKSLTSSFLGPLAAEAADATTGPDVLKLQTFTARYKSKTKSKPPVRAIPNTTAALLANSFFSPLTAHFQVAIRSSKPLILNPALLALYLQTLGIIIHAAGPSTLSLPQLTSELWDLLLGVRVHVLGDLGAVKGWFVAMACLLEVNQGDMRQMCEAQGREVVETREWVSGVFERTRGEDGGEENEVKMLAAGVLIRLGEAIEKYQALLMGDMIGFS